MTRLAATALPKAVCGSVANALRNASATESPRLRPHRFPCLTIATQVEVKSETACQARSASKVFGRGPKQSVAADVDVLEGQGQPRARVAGDVQERVEI